MKNQTRSFRPFAALGTTLLLTGLASIGFTAHNASMEVGRWVGFAHAGDSQSAGASVVLDLAGSSSPSEAAHLQGTLSLLPSYSFAVTGAVSGGGHVQLTLKSDGWSGQCDGTVSNVAGFTKDGDPDAIGDINFSFKNAAGQQVKGHMNLIHLYGGANWASASAPSFQGSARGAYMLPMANLAGSSSLDYSAQQGSFFSAGLNLGSQSFQAVGTASDQGSVIMLCDGSVHTDGAKPALIGLLFTGAVALDGQGAASAVGHFGGGFFGLLLPAVQKVRDGALSFAWSLSS